MNHTRYIAFRYARRAAFRAAQKRGLTCDQTRQVCCIATLAIHKGASLTDAVAAARRLATTLATEHRSMSAIERQHALQQVSPCACRRQPKLYRFGTTHWFIECWPCQLRTQYTATERAAILDWEARQTQTIRCTRAA